MANVIDPYADASSSSTSAGWDDTAPKATSTTPGPDTVLQLYVPAENTLVDLGAGATPGIRMETDPHIHLTARAAPATETTATTTLTSLSLGTPAGPGFVASGTPYAMPATVALTNASILAPGPGLNTFTTGSKWERIEGATSELYDGTAALQYGGEKLETIQGDWSVTAASIKKETVTGAVTETYDSTQDVSVSGIARYSFGDDYHETIQNNYYQTINGKTEGSYEDDSFTYNFGARNATYLGLDSTIALGATVDVMAGLAMEVNVGVSLGVSLSLSAEYNFATVEHTSFSYENTATDLEDLGTKISTSLASIRTSVVSIFK